MLTPAISVLSAVEGLTVATPVFVPVVHLIAIAVLIGLFSVQWRGTSAVGVVFGPVMLLWFATLAVLGARWVVAAPEVLAAVSPSYAVRFLAAGGTTGYVILGAVFLVVTGGEALYADIGHFGKLPIRLMWFAVVLPGVLINYFGQGAMLLRQPAAVHHTFYSLAPDWALYPLVGLATAAAVIASQAIIAGAFSLTSQALQLGYTPRVEVRHSSEDEEGQVYVPLVNWLLLIAAVGLVVYFRSTDALAGAYGVAVSGTMVLTTVLAFVYFRHLWGWGPAGALAAFFLPIDLTFLGANLVKINQGGWFPLLVGVCGYLLFTTWTKGQTLVLAEQDHMESDFLNRVRDQPPLRVPGTAVFLTRVTAGVPRTLLLNLAHNHVLHEQVVLLTVATEAAPRVPREECVRLRSEAAGMVSIVAHYGYLQRPNVPQVLHDAVAHGLRFDPATTTYFLARVSILVSRRPGMARWRKRLFAFLAQNGLPATAHYRIPSEQVFEIGVRADL